MLDRIIKISIYAFIINGTWIVKDIVVLKWLAIAALAWGLFIDLTRPKKRKDGQDE